LAAASSCRSSMRFETSGGEVREPNGGVVQPWSAERRSGLRFEDGHYAALRESVSDIRSATTTPEPKVRAATTIHMTAKGEIKGQAFSSQGLAGKGFANKPRRRLGQCPGR
jgi:hypothetical protein